MIIELRKYDDKLLLHDGLTMFTFSSPDCIPCKFINPIVNRIATNNDNIHVYRINCLEHPALAEYWQIKSVPTVFFFYNKELKHVLKSVAGIKHQLELIDV